MSRHRQVRFEYPPALVELAMALSSRCGKRNAADTLNVPLSTVYRWSSKFKPVLGHHCDLGGEAQDLRVLELIADCEAHGFNLRERVLSTVAVGRDFDAFSASPLRPAQVRKALASTTLGATHRPDAPLAFRSQEHIGNRHSGESWDVSARTRRYIERARAKIERRYYSSLSCDELSSNAGISKWHFIKSFGHVFGMSPYRYLQRVRIRQAKKLLFTTHQSLDAVAVATGFDTTSSLCKAFRTTEGMSLSSFFRGIRLGHMPKDSGPIDGHMLRQSDTA